MLRDYLPALVFLLLGLGVGTALMMSNRILGPRRRSVVKSEPYECGLPSEVTSNFRFGIRFYTVAMMFIVFDIEIVLLYPVAIILGVEQSVYALVAVLVFVFFLAVAYVYEWRAGSFDWR